MKKIVTISIIILFSMITMTAYATYQSVKQSQHYDVTLKHYAGFGTSPSRG